MGERRNDEKAVSYNIVISGDGIVVGFPEGEKGGDKTFPHSRETTAINL